jgi:hypothetical protein
VGENERRCVRTERIVGAESLRYKQTLVRVWWRRGGCKGNGAECAGGGEVGRDARGGLSRASCIGASAGRSAKRAEK